MPSIVLTVDKSIVRSDSVPVRVFANVRNDRGFPLGGAHVMLNVDGTNIHMGQTDASGVIDYTQTYGSGTHRMYAWMGENVSQVVTFQVNKAPERQRVCAIAISQLEQKRQYGVGSKLRFKVTAMKDEDGNPYTELPHTVYLAFDNEMIDSNVTDNSGLAYFDVVFQREGKFTIYAYDESHQSDVMYVEVMPATAVSPESIYRNNFDNFREAGNNAPAFTQAPQQATDIIGQILGWLKGVSSDRQG